MDNIRYLFEKLPSASFELRSIRDQFVSLKRTLSTRQIKSGDSDAGTRSITERARATQRARTRAAETKPLQFTLEGELRPGSDALFNVNGHDLITTPDTWVFGELTIGAQVKVKGVIVRGHERVCTSIIASPLV